jgi:hypothetical protein
LCGYHSGGRLRTNRLWVAALPENGLTPPGNAATPCDGLDNVVVSVASGLVTARVPLVVGRPVTSPEVPRPIREFE